MHEVSTIENPSIDDLMVKLDSSLGKARSKINDHKSALAVAAQRDAVSTTQREDDNILLEDKENCNRDKPDSTASVKPSLFRLSEQKKEVDKLRIFSVQLQLMHTKGRAAMNASTTDSSLSNFPDTRSDNISSMESAHLLANGTARTDASAVTYRVSNCRNLVSNSTVGNSTSSEESHQEVVMNALRMASASTKIQAVFKGSKVRSKLARDRIQQQVVNVAATSIQAKWRARVNLVKYRQSKRNIVISQAIVRMWLAMRRLNILCAEVTVAFERYRSQLELKNSSISTLDMTLSQPLTKLEQLLKTIAALQLKWGVFAVTKCEFKTKEQRALEDKNVTAISAWWRAVHCKAAFNKTVKDVILCQSIARRNADSKRVDKLWNDYRRECAAILIQANWREHTTSKEYQQIKASIVIIQSAARMMVAAKRWKMLRTEILSAFARFQSQGEYTLTEEDIKVCQAVVQSCSTDKVKPVQSKKTTVTTGASAFEVSYSTNSNSVTITSNEISILCKQITTKPEDRGSGINGSHDFAMIYMFMVSSEADVEAIYLQSCSEEN